MKKLISYFIVIVVLHSCGGLSDAERVLRNEKKSNTDEFLVKKRQPLTLPPEYDAIPEPNSNEKLKSNAKNKNELNEILKIPEEKISNKNFKSIEDSIINKINK